MNSKLLGFPRTEPEPTDKKLSFGTTFDTVMDIIHVSTKMSQS